jgi:6,7-dimethyl-8-ribityllumazine synthase
MRSQGGVKFPTGGDGNSIAQARERPAWLFWPWRGQQIRCDSGVDGNSPDERDAVSATPFLLFLHKGPLRHCAPWVLVHKLSSSNITMVQTSTTTSSGATPPTARIAFIQSGWHTDIINQGRDAFQAEMRSLGTSAEAIDVFKVPGAFEIPLHAQKLARTGRYAAIVACGFVVNGGIYRHDFVADAVISGLMQVQLDSGIPVFSVVLTPLHFHEHDDHQQFFAAHFVTKGKEAARACMETLESLHAIAA